MRDGAFPLQLAALLSTCEAVVQRRGEVARARPPSVDPAAAAAARRAPGVARAFVGAARRELVAHSVRAADGPAANARRRARAQLVDAELVEVVQAEVPRLVPEGDERLDARGGGCVQLDGVGESGDVVDRGGRRAEVRQDVIVSVRTEKVRVRHTSAMETE